MNTINVGYSVANNRGTVLRFAEASKLSAPLNTAITISPGLSSERRMFDVFLRGSIAPGWMIVVPLPVRLERDEDGTYIYSDDIFLVYGAGDTSHDALRDYINALIEYYDLLAGEPDNQPTQVQLRHLQTYLRPVPA